MAFRIRDDAGVDDEPDDAAGLAVPKGRQHRPVDLDDDEQQEPGVDEPDGGGRIRYRPAPDREDDPERQVDDADGERWREHRGRGQLGAANGPVGQLARPVEA